MNYWSNVRSTIAILALASSVMWGDTLAMAPSAPEVTMTIIGGQLTYSLSGGQMETLSFDYTQNENAMTEGSVLLLVDDARGTREGWTVEIESTAFTYSGSAPGENDIVAGHASMSPGRPMMEVGEGLEGVRAGAGGTLDARRVAMSADAGSGSGRYSQELTINLDIPARSPAGTYTAQLTVSTSAAPGGGN